MSARPTYSEATTPASAVSAPKAVDNPRYHCGFASGQAAAAQFLGDAPFDSEQKAWLFGFLSGLFSGHGEPPPPERNPMPGPSFVTPPRELRPVLSVAPLEPSPDLSKYNRDNPYAARVVDLTPLRSGDAPAWQLTLDIEGSGITCRPGDQLGVFPGNDPDIVRRMLRLLGARGQETVTTSRGTGPAWRALLEELDLARVTEELLSLLADCARNADEAARLELYARSGAPAEPTVLGILRRFPSARPALNDLVAALATLSPQYFPLASSQARHADTLEALVTCGAADAEANGLTADIQTGRLKQGDWLPVYVEQNPEGYPPTDTGAPVIVFAYGAAAACARAFLTDRAAAKDRGRNWLFIASDSTTEEPYYARQFAAWQTSRVLTRMDVAQRGQMVDRLGAQTEMLQRWLIDRSFVYVFGQQQDCEQFYHAFVSLLQERAQVDAKEAAARLETMRSSSQLRFVAL